MSTKVALQGNVAVKTDSEKFMTLEQVNKMVAAKRREDMFRFRTCCADPRASK